MAISKKVRKILNESSWIRKMFEEGVRLKSKHGMEHVYDFSLGNPNLSPPEIFKKALAKTINNSDSNSHLYMPNTGYLHVRKSVAAFLSSEQEVSIDQDAIIMTCGAAGALNVIFKALLDPGDEVIVPFPYFVEYSFYVDNHGGRLKPVKTMNDFSLDIDAIVNACTKRTKAVLINSPNNPTGQVYSKKNISDLGIALTEAGKKFGRMIYLISDEPYRKIVYDNIEVPSAFQYYRQSIIATSYSKDISIPGERIGFIAVHPEADYKDELIAGMAFANRILGFVNAPALMQRIVADIQGATVDVAAYARKRELLCQGLLECGYEFIRPAGAFYLFPKTPFSDDVKFVTLLKEEMVLTVPGSGFGCPGHFRIAFCVADNTIVNSLSGFANAMQKACSQAIT
jgi:aspartate aminotransferase